MNRSILIAFVTAIIVQIIFMGPTNWIFSKFSTTPIWLIFTMMVTIIPLLFYTIYIKFVKTEEQNEPPKFIERNKISIGVGIVLGSILLGFSNKNSLDNVLNIDNGTDNNISIEYSDRMNELQQINIIAGGVGEIILPIGKNKIKVNGVEKEFELGVRGSQYIYNVDKSNKYILLDVAYGDDSDQNFSDNIKGTYEEEFFRVNADYLFEAPESIITRGDNTKRVLLRYED